jgi:hypothetical protein
MLGDLGLVMGLGELGELGLSELGELGLGVPRVMLGFLRKRPLGLRDAAKTFLNSIRSGSALSRASWIERSIRAASNALSPMYLSYTSARLN